MYSIIVQYSECTTIKPYSEGAIASNWNERCLRLEWVL